MSDGKGGSKRGPGFQKRAGKYGKVVYIRVRPEDCMTCIDVAQKVGVVTVGMSFAQLISLALSTLCETVRDDGAVPKRSGFEYSEMMAPWDASTKNTKTKMRLNRAVDLQGSDYIIKPLPVGQANEDVVISKNPRIARYERLIQELQEKKKIMPENAEQYDEEILQYTNLAAEEYRKEQK